MAKKANKTDIAFIELINSQLLNARQGSKQETETFLMGLCSALETYLFQRDIYAGFSYINETRMVHNNELPGIWFHKQNDPTELATKHSDQFENTNPYRRIYHYRKA